MPSMEQYPDDYVDVKRPDDDSFSYRSRQYSLDVPPSSSQSHQTSSPMKPPMSHTSSSASNPAISSPNTSVAYDRPSPDGASSTSGPSSTGVFTSTADTGRPSMQGERRMSVGPAGIGGFAGMAGGGNGEEAVPVGFDEGILRGLCEMDCALPLLADRIKQSIASCKQVATFFRSRADIEEKYARSLSELGRTSSDVYSRADCKAGSFVLAYHTSFKLQEQLSQNRLRFSQRLNDMSDELLNLAREGEKARKIHKDTGTRYQAILQESESVVEKAKNRLDSVVDDLDRILAVKEGESLKDVRSGGAYNTVGGPQYGSGMGGGGGAGGGPQAGAAGSGGGKRVLGKAMKTGGLLFKGKGSGSLQRQEDDSRVKMDQANETFVKAVADCKQLRKEFFNFQLPKILRLLKEAADELDMGTQYHLVRYAFLYETMVVGDGTLLNPLGGPDEGESKCPGLKAIFESIDNRTDFKSYMQNYAVARGTPRGPRRDGPYDDGYQMSLPPHVQRSNDAAANSHAHPGQQSYSPQSQASAIHSSYSPNALNPIQSPLNSQSSHFTSSSIASTSTGLEHGQLAPGEGYTPPGISPATGATFGVDLGEQLARDGTAVPRVVEKCAEAIEAFGLESTGVYRLSGMNSRVQALKAALDKDVNAVDVMSEEWSSDINVVCGVLKLWFRELPEPLLTHALYQGFIDAARHENDRLRHIRLHEQVNELPDPNYATLKYFMGHLDRIRRKDSINQMSVSNLSIVFGPTLLGAPPGENGQDVMNIGDMQYQCKAIETILDKYHEIFVEEEGEEQAAS